MKITTVTGNIRPEEVGITSMHEHILAHMGEIQGATLPPDRLKLIPENMASLRSGMSIYSTECSIKDDVEYAVKELTAYKKYVNGGTICDASPLGLRGNANSLKRASRESGVNLVCCTGLYLMHANPDYTRNLGEKALIDLFSREIEEGIDGSDVYPGFVKCAIGTINETGNEVQEQELLTLKACAKTAAKYGLSLQIHTASPMTHNMVLDAADIALAKCGLAPDKLLMLHMDSFLYPASDIMGYVSGNLRSRIVSVSLPMQILSWGANIGFDAWGSPFETVLPNDFDRAKGLLELIQSGYEDHIVLGQDVISKAVGRTSGYYGFTRFAEFVPTMLKQLGYKDEIAQKLLVKNPARLLQY